MPIHLQALLHPNSQTAAATNWEYSLLLSPEGQLKGSLKKRTPLNPVGCSVPGLGGPSSERSVITPNLDGSVDVKLGEASVGGFTLPSVTGKVPSQPGVKINYGRRLMAEPVSLPAQALSA